MIKKSALRLSRCLTLTRSSSMTRRGAAALICAMTAAIVFLGMAGVAVRTSLKARQERKTEKDLNQIEFLLESGLLRAKEKLAENPDYQGETWLDEESPYGLGHWQIVISVTSRVMPPDTSTSTNASPGESTSTTKIIQVTTRMSERNYSPSTIQRTRQIMIRPDSN
jgi:hypothetical protein